MGAHPNLILVPTPVHGSDRMEASIIRAVSEKEEPVQGVRDPLSCCGSGDCDGAGITARSTRS